MNGNFVMVMGKNMNIIKITFPLCMVELIIRVLRSTYIVNSCWLFSWSQKITCYYTTKEDAYSLIKHVTVDGFQELQNVIHCCVSLQCELLSRVPSYGHHLFLFHVFWTQLYSDWYTLHKKKLLHFWVVEWNVPGISCVSVGVTIEHTKTYKLDYIHKKLHCIIQGYHNILINT